MISLFEKRASRLVIRDVAVLDPRDGTVTPHRDLLCNGGFVAAIAGPGELSAQVTGGAEVIDASGYYALPGLIDSHLHIAGVYQLEPPGLGETLSIPRQVAKNLRALIRSGVTTVRDMGAPAKMALWLRDRAAEGRLESPKILTPGPVFTAPGGYPTFMEELPPAVAWGLEVAGGGGGAGVSVSLTPRSASARLSISEPWPAPRLSFISNALKSAINCAGESCAGMAISASSSLINLFNCAFVIFILVFL